MLLIQKLLAPSFIDFWRVFILRAGNHLPRTTVIAAHEPQSIAVVAQSQC